MPNWCRGTMKVRGSEEDITRFLTTALKPVAFIGGASEPIIKRDDYSIELSGPEGTWAFHVEGTHRNFVGGKHIKWYIYQKKEGEKHILFLDDYHAAWGIDAGSLAELSREYNLDFKIYAFEAGMEFNQDIEVVNGEIIKNDEIEFDDYEWECIHPRIGG